MKRAFEIVSSDFQSEYLTQLYDWFVGEWGEVDAFETSRNGIGLPSPVLATQMEMLIGGLSFTAHPVFEEKDEMALWINALFVLPESRGQGVGTRLVLAAENLAKEVNAVALYTRTQVPELYAKLGWYLLEDSKHNTILKKDFG